jgi:NAD(P)-dependent dehydrogenase (short-subunit alcohol dehydrogenase family)
MTTVLVTGGGERLTEVAKAIEAAGAETTVVDTLDRLGEAVGGKTFDGYVQLPVTMTPRQGGSLVSRVEQFLSEGLLSRFRAAETVLPSLAESANVILVGGQTNIDSEAPDDQQARTALMRVLAHALRAERAPSHLRVRTVGPEWSATDIAAKVTGGGGSDSDADQSGDRQAIGKAYADWRAEVLGLARVEF